MTRDDMEKRFSAYLDRILAGEDVGATPDLDEKYRDDLEFARKMVGLRVTPSPAYQARLRAELLHKLVERDIKQHEKRGLMDRPFWRQPLWQGITIVVFVVLMGVILWRAGVFPTIEGTSTTTTSGTTTSASTTTATKGQLLVVSAGTDMPVYTPGETVTIQVTLRNVSGGLITLNKLPPILSIMSADTGQPAYTFQAGATALTLPQNGSTTFTYDWDQRDFYGQQVAGRYYIELEDLEYNGMPLPLDPGTPVEFDILDAY